MKVLINKPPAFSFYYLLDPDRLTLAELEERTERCAEAGADAILVGTSLMLSMTKNANVFDSLRQRVKVPVISFPGDAGQVVSTADAILFLSMVSGRNRLRGIVEEVRREGLVAQVRLRIGDQSLTAVITRDALDELRLKRGDEATARVKATEVMVAKEVLPEVEPASARRRA